MKTLIALSALALSSTAVQADWEHVFQNPDLSVNYEGYVEQHRVPSIDPVAASFPGNSDLFSGDSVEGGIGASSTASSTSYDDVVRGNPDFEV